MKVSPEEIAIQWGIEQDCTCELNHGKDKAPEAIASLVIEDEGQDFVYRICESCQEALRVKNEWSLLVCLTCGSTVWSLNELARRDFQGINKMTKITSRLILISPLLFISMLASTSFGGTDPVGIRPFDERGGDMAEATRSTIDDPTEREETAPSSRGTMEKPDPVLPSDQQPTERGHAREMEETQVAIGLV